MHRLKTLIKSLIPSQKTKWLGLLAFSLFYVILYLVNNSPLDNLNGRSAHEKINHTIKRLFSEIGCKLPQLPVNSIEIQQYVKYVPRIVCHSTDPDWVVCTGSECIITEAAKIKYGRIKCSFTDLLRVNDSQSKNGETTNSYSYYKLENSDVVNVTCESQKGVRWKAVLTSIRFDATIYERANWSELPNNSLKLNVLMYGFDSLSRNSFIRKLPKSYAYLTEVLNGLVLEGYNIIGDGTQQALIPILTGKTELELPEVRKRIEGSGFVDQYPLIWQKYAKYGYVTGFLEDVAVEGTFNFRFNGFNKTPTDHYMRPYYIAASGMFHASPEFCAGSVPRHKLMMNYVKSFFSVYKKKPKFLFGFYGELSHDYYNYIGGADDDVVDFLTDLHTSGTLNNTIFIFMADHGHRFAHIRNTIQGKLEERLPFFSFTFPPWFRTKHERLYNNFVSNTKRLTTPFDIFETLKDILMLDSTGDVGVLSKRSTSLFKKISLKRSCADAFIEPHWCTCLDWHDIPLSSNITTRLGVMFVAFLNNYTNSHRNLCAELKIYKLFWVKKLVPNDHLLRFNKSVDEDFRVPDFRQKTVIRSDMYQIKALLKPGDSLFEASITHFIKEDQLQLKLSDISRTNMYGTQARCIKDKYPNLRKYCYCVEAAYEAAKNYSSELPD